MKLQSFIFFLLLIGVGACCGPNSLQDQVGIEKERLANEVLHKVAFRLKQETGLRPIGTMGQMHYEVERLGLSFYYYKPIDIVEGRSLLVQAVNAMLEEVNQEKRIHPYLCRYPFLPRNIEIEIFLRSPEGGDVPQGALWIVDAKGGCLRYDIHHPTHSGFITVYKETFDEALQRLADPSLPLVAFEPDPEMSQEELRRLRKGIGLVSDDGSIWHLGENGSWIQDPQSVKGKE